MPLLRRALLFRLTILAFGIIAVGRTLHLAWLVWTIPQMRTEGTWLLLPVYGLFAILILSQALKQSQGPLSQKSPGSNPVFLSSLFTLGILTDAHEFPMVRQHVAVFGSTALMAALCAGAYVLQAAGSAVSFVSPLSASRDSCSFGSGTV